MDNQSFKKFINQDFSELSNWIDTLNPYEFALVGALIAFLIAPTLNANQMNSIGNFLEEIGQVLLTISSQTITVKQAKSGNTTSYGLYDIFSNGNLEKIKKEIMKDLYKNQS